jgi:hypothetical protein
MKTEVPGLVVSQLAAVALAKGLFVMPDGNVCGALKKALGVCKLDTASGEYAPIDTSGIVLMLSGGAITVTDEAVPVASDAAGKAIAATALSATVPGTGTTVTSSSAQPAMTIAGSYTPQKINGYALDSAGGANEWIRVKLV